MRVFMRELMTGNLIQVFENDWKEDDVYINDPLHHSLCWGDCYTLKDVEKIVKSRRTILHPDGMIEVDSMLKGLHGGPCHICKAETRWVEMNYETELCSAECLYIMNREFFKAMRGE